MILTEERLTELFDAVFLIAQTIDPLLCITDITGSSRSHIVVASRTAYVVLARELGPASYPELSLVMGRQGHSTAYTAHQRWKAGRDHPMVHRHVETILAAYRTQHRKESA